MKTASLNYYGIGGRRGLAIAAMLLLGVLAAAGFNSPVGTWDFMLNGSGEQGIAFLTFVSDSPSATSGSFYGYELISSPHNITVPGGRNPGADAGRTGSGTSTNQSAITYLFGFGPISGPWQYDTSGRVIGFFDQVVNSSGPTVNWLGNCVEAFVPYATTAVATNGTVVDTNAIMNLAFCLTNSVTSTNITWSSTNADGTTNVYEAVFTVGQTNAEVALLYSNFGPAGSTNSFANFEFALAGETGLSTNVNWDLEELSGTNFSSSISFTFTPVLSSGPGVGTSTNAVSFTGTVTPGRRFTLTSMPSDLNGKLVYTGVPYRPNLKNLSGNWYGYKHENGHPYLEFFSLASVGAAGGGLSTNGMLVLGPSITNFPTIYASTNGTGPGYSMNIIAMQSAWKRIGFQFVTIPDGSTGTENATMSATCGSFSTSASGARAITRGIEEPQLPILFNGTLFLGR